MVEPVTAVLTGIALVKQATSFIKENINTVNDISGIAKQIDQMFAGQQEINKERNRVANSTANELGLSNVTQSIIDAKLANEQMQEVKNMINLRFGPNTWDEILMERKRRIEAVKQQKLLAKKRKLEKQREMMATAKQATIGIGIVFTVVVLFIISYVAFASEEEECMQFYPKYYLVCLNEGKETALTEQYLDRLKYRQQNTCCLLQNEME
jgi:hypothetical protein